jgi:hypothetical protein
VNGKSRTALQAARGLVAVHAKELMFVQSGDRALGSADGDSQPSQVRLCSFLSTGDVGASVLEPARCLRCQKDAP